MRMQDLTDFQMQNVLNGEINVNDDLATLSLDDVDGAGMIDNEFSIDPSNFDSIHNVYGRVTEKLKVSIFVFLL